MPHLSRIIHFRWALCWALATMLALGGCTTDGSSEAPMAPGGRGADAAAQRLDGLTVAEAGSMRGYSRARFPHWRSVGEGCNVRDSVLRRDGEDVRLSGCDVVGGRWLSVYDNKRLTDPSLVDVDHVVPLANAWRSGASAWNDDRRGDFANDLSRPQLLSVSASSNRAKGDQDPSLWKPGNRDYWCEYAEDWITVKHHWRLSVTPAERTALAGMLETC